MPELDMSDAFGPENLDTFNVIRRPEVVNEHGESEVPAPELIEDVEGVVCMAGPDDLERLDDQDRMQRTISVVTKFRLRGPSRDGDTDWKPDVVVWDGTQYEVKVIDPYVRYGSGFVQALCASTAAIDLPPT